MQYTVKITTYEAIYKHI